MQKLSLAVQLGILNDRQIMLQTYPVGEPPQGEAGTKEITIFPGTVQRRGIVVNVDVGMGPVSMGHHKNKRVCPSSSASPVHSQSPAPPPGQAPPERKTVGFDSRVHPHPSFAPGL